MKILIFVLAVASLNAWADDPKFIFDQTVYVYKPKTTGLGEPSTVTPGTQISFDDDKVYWLEAKGKVPILILPQITQKTDGPLKLNMPDVANWPPNLVTDQLELKLSTLIDDLTKFQTAMRTKNTTEAEKVLVHMEGVAQLDYLYFLRASLEFAQGNMEGAKEHVKKALGRYPANEQGLKFLKALEGGGK